MHEVKVYIPAPGVTTSIDAESGIVGREHPHGRTRLGLVLEVYYEGNRFGAANIVTFADRVYHAADRMATNYPTIARGVFPADELEQVGTFDGDRVQLLPDGGKLTRLARWVGAGVQGEAGFVPDISRLDTELRRTR